MESNIQIREALVRDALVLAAAERNVARIPGRLVSEPTELVDEAFVRRIESLSNAPNGRYIVALVEGQITGHALLAPMGLRAIRHVARLTIVVHDGYSRRGIGRAMLDHLLAWARAEPTVEKIELLVREGNEPAIGLYRAAGFTPEGVHIRRVKLPDGGYLDDVAMALWVGPGLQKVEI